MASSQHLDDQAVYGVIAQAVACLPDAMRKRVQQIVTQLRAIVVQDDIEGAMALALLGAEYAAKSEAACGSSCCCHSAPPLAAANLPTG